jgi:hypothetical protein
VPTQVRGLGVLASETSLVTLTVACSWAGGLKMKKIAMPLLINQLTQTGGR